MELNKFRKVGNYEISNVCFETYPCKHSVKFSNGDIKIMSGDNICRLFATEGLSDPHINEYTEFVRQQDFPTPEEIKQRTEQLLKIQQATEKIAEKEKETKKIINQYKASSRIDRLKNQNNIKK